MNYTIDKGSHRSKPNQFKLIFNPVIVKKVIFDFNCKYDLHNDDQLDINKLFGIGFFPGHHRNSARFGWRWNRELEMVEIFAYIYNKGSRISAYLTTVKLGVQYEYSLYVESDHYFFMVKDSNGWTRKALVVNSKNNFPRIGYYLKPYFGGNNTAPHSMNIIIKP